MLVEMFTKVDCPTCEKAKEFLRMKNISFTEYVVGQDVTRDSVMAQFPNRRAVPIILVDGKEVVDVASFQLLLEG